jgi:hypothetical protein
LKGWKARLFNLGFATYSNLYIQQAGAMNYSDNVDIIFVNYLVYNPVFIEKQFSYGPILYFRNWFSGGWIRIKLIYSLEYPVDELSRD